MAIDEALRSELLRRREVDQGRDQWLRDAVGPDGYRGELTADRVRQWRRIDEDNTAFLRQVLTERGWPGRSLVGEDGAHAAWLLAVHAVVDRDLARRCLQMLGEAVRAGEAAAQDWACLLDRVLLADGRAQLFGTQLASNDGQYHPERLHAEDSVDVLRSLVGLDPMNTYLAEMTNEHPPVQITARAPG